MAAAGRVRAGARAEEIGEVVLVEVAEGLVHDFRRVVVRLALVRVHPEVDAGRQLGPQRGDLGDVLLQPDDADAEPHAPRDEFAALREELRPRRLRRR